MIESFVHAKNGLRELGLCGEGEWRAKEVVSRVEEITSEEMMMVVMVVVQEAASILVISAGEFKSWG
jgi:hypothetical protein